MAIGDFVPGTRIKSAVMNAKLNYLEALAVPPAGSIQMYPSTAPPTGWLICDGSAISRSDYGALFAVIGTTFGVGDGSTTFNLPNLKGKVPVGRDSTQTEFDVIGETGGAKTHTLSTAEMPAHSHTDSGHTHGIKIDNTNAAPSGGASEVSPGPAVAYSRNLNTLTGNANIQNTGGGGAHNNLQPYLVLNYIIRT